MDTNELKYLIALPLLPEVGQKRAREMYEFFGSAENVFLADEQQLAQIPNIGKATVSSIINGKKQALQRAEKELIFVERHQINCYCYFDDNYPYRLRECEDAPLLIYSKGNVRFNSGKMVAVVGTRMPTDAGKERCQKLIRELAAAVGDITVISGLAYGIDVTAHKAAIEAGIPTIIIPAHGLDRIYPAIHRQVAINALEKGGILTEYMSETEPEKQNFVARNRIVAGLSDCVVVVESRKKGGSLITAEMAWNYNRDIFTFPGRPEDINSAGCNNLIKRQKASLIECADDIIDAMRWRKEDNTSKALQTELFVELNETESLLMKLLADKDNGVHFNDLLADMKLSFSNISALLLDMEMRGLIKSMPGGRYRAVIR